MSLGIHSGASEKANWGSGLKKVDHKQIDKAFSVEESQHAARNVETTGSPEKAAATPQVQQSTTTEKTKQQKVLEPEARPLSKGDIIDQLLQIKATPSKENQQIIMAILEHGLEASGETFETISKLIKGKNKPNTLESSIVSLTKGLTNSTKSVDILSYFLSENPTIAKQLKSMQTNLTQTMQGLRMSRELFDKGLFSGISSILLDMDETLKKLTKKANDQNLQLANLKRGSLLSDIKSLHDFLGGITNLLSETEKDKLTKASKLTKEIKGLKKSISGLIKNLTAQMILSKKSAQQQITNEKFAFWQIPNPMAQTSSDIDILIRHDTTKKKEHIDPKKTKIIIKLETPDLGTITVMIEIQDKKVWCTFISSERDTKKSILKVFPIFKKTIESYNYEIVGVKTTNKKIDTKKLLIPTFNLDDLSRIRMEV
jgi:hypothetical protein